MEKACDLHSCRISNRMKPLKPKQAGRQHLERWMSPCSAQPSLCSLLVSARAVVDASGQVRVRPVLEVSLLKHTPCPMPGEPTWPVNKRKPKAQGN